MNITISGNLNTDYVPQTEKQVQEPGKGPTFAEKLMSVRNSQCELYFNRLREKLQHYEVKQLTRLREETNRINYDLKTMKVMKKKRDLEIKRFKSPHLDTEQDEFEIRQAERYLVFDPNICFYTNKKNKIPLRSLAKLDPHHTTPTIAKARKILQDMTNERKISLMQEKRSEMYSRAKSARSVRFQTPQSDYNSRNTRPVKSAHYRFKQGGLSQYDNEQDNLVKTQFHNSGIYQSPDRKKEETLLTYLKKARNEQDKRQELLIDTDDAPDDYIQCLQRNTQIDKSDEDENDKAIQGFHLPSVTGEEKIQMFVDSQKEDFKTNQKPSCQKDKDSKIQQDNNDTDKHLSRSQSPQRPVKSAGVMTRTSHKSQYYQRQMSATSANSLKRKQYTHAVMRRENREIESKVQNFLGTFENKLKYKRLIYTNPFADEKPVANATSLIDDSSKSDKSDQNTDKDAKVESLNQRPKTATIKSGNAAVHLDANSLKQQLNTHSAVGAQEQKTKVRGIPSHSEGRSKRHSATFKLRKVVQELMKNRTKQEIMAYEKAKDSTGSAEQIDK